MSENVILTVEQATNLGIEALRAIGLTEEESQVITAHLVDAALCGYFFPLPPPRFAVSALS